MKVVGTMKPIERISIVDQVINNLKDYIVEQNVAVGDQDAHGKGNLRDVRRGAFDRA